MSNINKNTIKKMAKKGAKVTLCAALAGGLLLGDKKQRFLKEVKEGI